MFWRVQPEQLDVRPKTTLAGRQLMTAHGERGFQHSWGFTLGRQVRRDMIEQAYPLWRRIQLHGSFGFLKNSKVSACPS